MVNYDLLLHFQCQNVGSGPDVGDLEKVESGGEGDVGEVQADGEGVSATGIEVNEDIGIESGGHISLGSTVGEDNDSKVVGNEYAGDFATSDGVDMLLMNMLVILQHQMEWIIDFATSDGLDNVLLHIEEKRRMEIRLRYRTQINMEAWLSPLKMKNMKMVREGGASFPYTMIRILFKDAKQFKSAIQKYSKECRRQLKFIENELERVVMRCIASPNCPWRIRASYSPVAKCLQIKTFQDEHRCSVSFKNKMVTAAMISQHFEANIKDYPKMKLREIKRRRASEMHVNVTIDCCYRAKKIVNEKMKDKDVYDNLTKKSPKMWTRAFFGTTCKSDIVDNNLCEVFNTSIVEAKFKNIIRMLEDIGTKMMIRYYVMDGVKAKFDADKKDCVEWQLIWNGENGCELRKKSYQYTVDLSQRICSCRMLLPIERKMPGRPKKNRRTAKDEPKKLKPGHLSKKGMYSMWPTWP
ncbi:hypothetical protein CXB51_017620 [Gossypium anomalum]|uniref:Transposase MuDR plant domain-containing protein n=1 Tax=Gossypium anomalum TaxID=47600 RepID=A0A8J5YY10_9ROSI|nr:hypothetical protein CXB51_017620 [Gossypium anomalum]